MPVIFFFRIIVLICLLTSCNTYLQKAIKEVDKQGIQDVSADTVYRSFIDRYNLLVGYTSYKAGGTNLKKTYNIIAFKKGVGIGYKYEIPFIISGNNKKVIIDSIILEKEMQEKVLIELYNAQGWNMNYDDTINDAADDYCNSKSNKQCFILDGLTYNLTISTKSKVSKSNLYAPDKYETECCKGNENRIKFLKLKSIIDTVLTHQ